VPNTRVLDVKPQMIIRWHPENFLVRNVGASVVLFRQCGNKLAVSPLLQECPGARQASLIWAEQNSSNWQVNVYEAT
jgi:hypothetical protein